MREIVFGFGMGVGFAFGILVVALTASLISDMTTTRDDSDSKQSRSGLQVLTDEKTGLQYLRSKSGMTPRFDQNGKQLRVDQ